MINRGRHNHLHLYEVTKQDLLIPTEKAAGYHPGNVLIFADKKAVDLGNELARADDMATAREYLANSETLLYEHIQVLESQIKDYTTRIEQRDGLLRDISDDLRYERDTAAFLQKQLDEAQYQLEIEALSKHELVGDLQHVSAETHTVEIALEKTVNEKIRLEQELASHLADLVELNLQNDDLKRQLSSVTGSLASSPPGSSPPGSSPPGSSPPGSSPPVSSPPGSSPPVSSPPASSPPASSSPITNASAPASPALDPTAVQTPLFVPEHQDGSMRQTTEGFGEPQEDGRVLTVSSGKQIHIYHEFSVPPARSKRAMASMVLRTILRVIGVVLVVAALSVILSVVATAQLNDVSFGEALDLLIKMVFSNQPG